MTDNSAYSGQSSSPDDTQLYPEQTPLDPAIPPVADPSIANEEPIPALQEYPPQDTSPPISEPPLEVAPEPPAAPPTPEPLPPVQNETEASFPNDDVIDPSLGEQYEAQMGQSSNAYQRPQPEQVIVEWKAASRPFKKRNRQYYTTIGVIVFLICMILFFAGQFLPIAVVIAVAFMAYVLSAVPPETVFNRITTYGIRTDENLYYWEELGRFWFTDKFHQRLVHVEVARFPYQLTLVLGEISEAEITDIFGTVLLNEKPALNSFDKAAQWLQEKIPLDTEA